MLLVPAVVLLAIGAMFFVTRLPSGSADEPRLVVTSTALSGAGVAAVDSERAGAPFVVRLIGDAAGSLSIALDAPCAQLPAVDLVVSTGSAGAVPLSTPACAAATEDWVVAELSPDLPVASFTLGAVPVEDRTGPADWRGSMVLSLGAGADVVEQTIAMSLTGDGGVVVEDPDVLLPPSSTTSAGPPPAQLSDPPGPTTSGDPSDPTVTARPSGGAPSSTGSPQRRTVPGTTGGESTGGGSPGGGSTDGGSTGGGSTTPDDPAPTSESGAPSSSGPTTDPEPSTEVPPPDEPSGEAPADPPVDPVPPEPPAAEG